MNKDGRNKGRSFWTCPNSKGAQCKYFEVSGPVYGAQTFQILFEIPSPHQWDDEALQTTNVPAARQRNYDPGGGGGGGQSGGESPARRRAEMTAIET